MSTTPRTDAVASDVGGFHGAIVQASFARRLETELATQQQLGAALSSDLQDCQDENAALRVLLKRAWEQDERPVYDEFIGSEVAWRETIRKWNEDNVQLNADVEAALKS